MFEMLSNRCTTLVCGDIALEGDNSRDWLDGGEIDTDNDALGRHTLRSYLTPGLIELLETNATMDGKLTCAYPGGRAKIQKYSALFQKPILFVQLHQLERSSCSVSLFFCQVIPFIQTAFSVLLAISMENPLPALDQLSVPFSEPPFWHVGSRASLDTIPKPIIALC